MGPAAYHSPPGVILRGAGCSATMGIRPAPFGGRQVAYPYRCAPWSDCIKR